MPPHTAGNFERVRDRALLFGPFPEDGLARGASDGALLLSEDPQVRALALRHIRAMGATVVRIPVNWRNVVAAEPPSGFVASDPADGSYDFARVDAAVISTASVGLSPLLVVSHAPAFAEAPHRWPYAFPGSWAPQPQALEDFAKALTRRYGGAFADAAAPGGVLPRVRLFQAWNEPNLARYLEPQWVAVAGRWHPFSPLLYRQMLNAFYAGVKTVDPADEVITAGLAPDGDVAGIARMAPVTFLQSMLCLSIDRAGRSRSTRCAEPPHFDVLAFHPLSVGSPDVPAASALDVSIADAAKVTGLLRQALRLRTALPAGKKPVWVTEINWESQPQSRGGVPPPLQAPWLSRALHRLWVAGVSEVTWEFVQDPSHEVVANTSTGGTIEYPRAAGLYTAPIDGNPETAKPKPFLRAFTLPFDPLRVDARRVRVWALLMRPRQPAVLQRQARAGGAWRTIAHLRAGSSGVLNALVSLRGAMHMRVLSGSLSSAVALVPAGRSRL